MISCIILQSYTPEYRSEYCKTSPLLLLLYTQCLSSAEMIAYSLTFHSWVSMTIEGRITLSHMAFYKLLTEVTLALMNEDIGRTNIQ